MSFRNADGLTEEEFLANYKPGDYERPSVTVDMLVLGLNKTYDKLKVLLIKRGNHPFINCWALPGGFVDINESAYKAACRELEEETGLTNVYFEQLYTFSQPDRDPRMRVIDISYLALVNETPVCAGDDAKEALWFDISLTENKFTLSNRENNITISYKLKKKMFKNGVVKVEGYEPVPSGDTQVAFDHAEIILEGLLRLRGKIEKSDIVFNLMPREFTLPDLQRVYEVILGRELYKSNFRGSLLGKVEALNKKGTSLSGRKKSTLYKYKG